MILIEIETNKGLIRSVSVSGHAAIAVCAAVGVLVRTCAATLREYTAVEVEGSAPGEGELTFRVSYGVTAPVNEACGVSRYLLTGISGLADENPRECAVQIKELRSNWYGT